MDKAKLPSLIMSKAALMVRIREVPSIQNGMIKMLPSDRKDSPKRIKPKIFTLFKFMSIAFYHLQRCKVTH